MSNAQQNCRGWRREEGVEGKGAGGGKGGVMTQSLYAHMNKGKKNFLNAQQTCNSLALRTQEFMCYIKNRRERLYFIVFLKNCL
jgi:hypothetical protein